MKWIKAEGVDFKYIFPNDMLGQDCALFNSKLFLRGCDVPEDIYKELQSGMDTRLAVFKRPLPQKTAGPIKNILIADTPYCLIWSENDINLKELDQKVKDGIFSDDDFYHSIRTHVHRVLCRNCLNEYIALTVDQTDIYFSLDENGKPDKSTLHLLENKLGKQKLIKCPNCNTVFTLYVVKILYECKEHLFRDIYQKR